MTRQQIIEISALVFGVAFIAWYFSPSGAPLVSENVPTDGAAATSNAPEYLAFNLPKSDYSLASLAGSYASGSQPGAADSSASGCGCSPVLNEQFYDSFGSLIDSFGTDAAAIQREYRDNIVSAMPEYVAQYFGNVYGAQLSNSSRVALGG